MLCSPFCFVVVQEMSLSHTWLWLWLCLCVRWVCFVSRVRYKWVHRSVGADTLSIPAGSDGSCSPVAGYACSYYIAVQGFTASSFSVVAFLHSDVPVTLLDGVCTTVPVPVSPLPPPRL
jgi:hypothetical protein